MQQVEVKIKEKDKRGGKLTLFNFREELVNFMYKKTIADSSRTSMRFFILIFFLSLKTNKKSLLMALFDENLDNLKRLNKIFSQKSRLERGDYSDLVAQNGLEDVFRYDTFFILLETVLDSDRVFKKFSKYFSENQQIKDEFQAVVDKYKDELEEVNIDFQSHLISDDRVDDDGQYHDLSKSVYRTIKMRTSRQIDLSLHKYAEVKIISSKSPIDLSLIQHIDTQIIIDLWERCKLVDYIKIVWNFTNDHPLVSGFAGTVLAEKFLKLNLFDGRTQRREKLNAKEEFENAKNNRDENERLLKLVEVLTDSIVKSNDHLQSEIGKLKEIRGNINDDKILTERKKDQKNKELEDKINRLENIEIDIKEPQDE